MKRMLRIGSWLLTFLLAAAPLYADGERRSANDALFDQAAYHEHVAYLASEELEGRGTGQPGIDVAAEYIADYFRQCGVRPAGDDRTYFQEFTLNVFRRIARGTRLKFGTDGRRAMKRLDLHDDFIPFPFSGSGRVRGDVVFVGYGIVNDDLEYDDYDGIDVTDKVLLMLRRAPQFAEFGIRDEAFRAKARRADDRDAAAILVVNPTFDEEGDALFDFESAGGMGMRGRDYGLPMMHVTREVAETLLAAGGLPDLETLEARIDETRSPASAALEGVSVRGRVRIEPVESPVKNVVGLIPGTGPQKDEVIVLGAHYDHLGIRKKGRDDFDPDTDISNGADDNASGTALVMALADAFTRGPPPNRSLLLTLFTGEERGLLGSAHFARHPTVDLAKIVAMFNFDMVGRLRHDRLHVAGMKTGQFEPMVRLLASSHGLDIKDLGGGRGPSDHTHFYNKDIPVLFFHTGLHKEYHRPEDDTELVNFEGAIRVAKFAADALDAIDASASPPVFHEDKRRDRVRLTAREGEEEPAKAAEQVALTGRPESGDARVEDLDQLRREIEQELAELRPKLAGKGKARVITEAEAMLNESRRRELNEDLLTLHALETELQVDMLGKKSQLEALKAESLPRSPALTEKIENDSRIQALRKKLDEVEVSLDAEASEQGDESPSRKELLRQRDSLRRRIAKREKELVERFRATHIDDATRNYLEAQSNLLRITEQLFETRAELEALNRAGDASAVATKHELLQGRYKELVRFQQMVEEFSRAAGNYQSNEQSELTQANRVSPETAAIAIDSAVDNSDKVAWESRIEGLKEQFDKKISDGEILVDSARKERLDFVLQSRIEVDLRAEMEERLRTLVNSEAELKLELALLWSRMEELRQVDPDKLPITTDLRSMLEKDPELRILQDRLYEAEDAVQAALLHHSDDPEHEDVATAKEVRDMAADRLDSCMAEKTIQFQVQLNEDASAQYIQGQHRLLQTTEQLFETRANIHDMWRKEEIADVLAAELEEQEQRLRDLKRQRALVESIPIYAEMATAMSSQFENADVIIRFSPDSAAPEFEVVVRCGEKRREGGRRPKTPAAPKPKAESKKAVPKGSPAVAHKKSDKKKEKPDDPHADMPDDVSATPMPPVRLGIMPSYGETEGEGYEISGVVEGGPAAKAGMKDDDRIYKIGDKLVTDIYSYMDALRKFKPGDVVPVTVIRDGKKVELKVKVAKQKSQEAA